jgi:hypothetical protein
MSELRRRTTEEVGRALLWAMFGGALIGGGSTTIWIIVETGGRNLHEVPLSVLFAPLGLGALSLFVVMPCTLLFGLPSVALIHHFALGRWPALAVCVAAALATQVASVWLLFWQEWSSPDDHLWTTPFALGAAVTLWWRMTRP